MESKTADLAKIKVKIFVGVVCLEGLVYALTTDGHLYIYDKNRKLQKWMNIKIDRATCCSISDNMLFCSGSDGIIRIFDPKTLTHVRTLSKPPPLGSANIEENDVKVKKIP